MPRDAHKPVRRLRFAAALVAATSAAGPIRLAINSGRGRISYGKPIYHQLSVDVRVRSPGFYSLAI